MPLLRDASCGDILTISFVESRILDEVLIQNIREELLAILKKAQEPNVILDFRGVRFLASPALGMLVQVHKNCKELKRNLILCNLVPPIRAAFKFTGLDTVLQICEDSEQAKNACKTNGPSAR